MEEFIMVNRTEAIGMLKKHNFKGLKEIFTSDKYSCVNCRYFSEDDGCGGFCANDTEFVNNNDFCIDFEPRKRCSTCKHYQFLEGTCICDKDLTELRGSNHCCDEWELG